MSIATKCVASQALSAEGQKKRKLSSGKGLPLDRLANERGIDRSGKAEQLAKRVWDSAFPPQILFMQSLRDKYDCLTR